VEERPLKRGTPARAIDLPCKPARLPYSRRRKALLSAAILVDGESFEREVIQAPLPVLVDFWGPNCAPCQDIAPIIDALSEELAGRLKVAKVSVEDAREVVGRYGVMGLPTLMLFKEGRSVETLLGRQSREAIAARVMPHLG
jgi:thioredoxin 1